ncbi:MAG: transpeptidase family protein [Deltaproteobacteria bacterium]|nr:transpeptidase family protein [Deltaproteobacteria bacterium]
MRRSYKGIRFRLGLAKILFIALVAMVGGRAVHLQIWQGESFKRLGERQHLKEWIVLPKRGALLDRAGEPLALSLESQSVYARPHRIQDTETMSRSLAQILSLDFAEVRQKLQLEKSFVWIKRQVSPAEADRIQALNLEGLGMFYEPNRYYPQGQLAGQVIGFVNRDSEGLEGLELQYNDYIRGETGSSLVERDALGRRVLVQGVEGLQIPPGGDIHLTLDSSIQHLAEKELEATISKYRAKAGVVIVVEPFTGEVLALANYPAFNPNNFSQETAQQRRNRAVADGFEPGSTFKTVLAAAALEEGVVGKEDLFYCEMGKYAYAGKIIHDTHQYGWLPFSKILQVSSNIGFIKVAEKLKKERYFKYIAVDLATHAFGQGISTTPMQLAMAYAAVANGGFLMKPYVVRRVLGPKGEILFENQPHVVRRVISEKTAHLLASMLKEVTNAGGTGTMASVEGFEVAGKTGTAQKADLAHGGYAAGKRVGSFVGFVPADDPRLVVLVLVDEPEVNVYGGVVAAPVFRNIARGALRHLAIAPQKPDALPPPVAQAGVPIRPPSKKENNGAFGAGSDSVPDFVGLSLREAVEKARSMNVKVQMHGNGYVVKQAPAPGGRWNEEGVLVLNLQG